MYTGICQITYKEEVYICHCLICDVMQCGVVWCNASHAMPSRARWTGPHPCITVGTSWARPAKSASRRGIQLIDGTTPLKQGYHGGCGETEVTSDGQTRLVDFFD